MKMKIILIIFSIIVILFVITQLFFLNSQRNIETYSFKVIDTYETVSYTHLTLPTICSV